jgi:predicted acetyltransferase
VASLSGDMDLDRSRTRFARDLPLTSAPRLVSTEEALALFPPVYDRVLATRPGMFTRTRAWWESRRLADLPARRGSAGILQRVVLERDGEAVGYALYRVNQALEHGISQGSVGVIEALGVDDEATRAVWRYLLDMDWTSRIRSSLQPLDHPLILLLAEPRRLGLVLGDALWVRVVDVGAALSARGYASPAPVVLDVRDPLRPQNDGRWSIADGRASRTSAPADVTVPIDALGSAFLGGFSFHQLAAAGRVTELRAGGLAAADRSFATERAPWCVEVF